jgi:hypothetical protein
MGVSWKGGFVDRPLDAHSVSRDHWLILSLGRIIVQD